MPYDGIDFHNIYCAFQRPEEREREVESWKYTRTYCAVERA